MARTIIDTWDPDYLKRSPIFDSIRAVCSPFLTLNTWPALEQLSVEFKRKNIESHNGVPIHPVGQGGRPESFEDCYESRIYIKGELQTRLENWHDFFNAMCWFQFPRIKSALNALHYESSRARRHGTNRGPLENAITLFDECGAIIVSDDHSMLDLIRNHQWKDLFLDNQGAFGKHVQCYVFGHAMFEKAVTPYVGMTAHSVLLEQAPGFFQSDYSAQVALIDQLVADCWLNKAIVTTKDLHPFPLLGIPGWWKENQDEGFYGNSEYFRGKSSLI